MSIATEFHNWSDQPSEDARRTEQGSPALMQIRDHHLKRWGGISVSKSSLYNPRFIDGTTRLSAHAGSAVDLRWAEPGPGRDVLLHEMLPFYIGHSQELHIQAIHDYVGCRVWRANRSHDGAGGWRTQEPGSHGGKMGASWAQWIHLEVNRSGWHDDRTVFQMLGLAPSDDVPHINGDGGFPPTDLINGRFGLFPLNPSKPAISIGARGDFVLYLQCVIFHKGGGAVSRDSDFGEQTQTRVMDLQRQFGLDANGAVEQPTWGVVDFLAGL